MILIGDREKELNKKRNIAGGFQIKHVYVDVRYV